jgi:hypothetical protein
MKTFIQWMNEHEVAKKLKWQQSVPKNVRQIDKEDLSKDYPGHLANMGSTYPFKLVGSKKK